MKFPVIEMKNYPHINPAFSLVFWNIIGIGVVIGFECWLLYSYHKPIIPKFQITFYAVLIFYYVFACYFFFPYVYRKYQNFFMAFGAALLLLFVYTFLYAVVNTVFLSVLFKHWIFRIQIADINVSFDRSSIAFIFAFAVWIARQYRANKKATAELRRQKKELNERFFAMQNLFLRSQMRSHLLYNSLTTIYLKIQESAPDAPGAMMLLIQLLDYDLKYGVDGMSVTIAEDLMIMEKYILLNQLLSSDHFYICINQDIDKVDTYIAPLLMQTFIENIFKHGELLDANNPVTIQIDLLDNEFHFYSSNNKLKTDVPHKRGIGLSNIKQRLNNLYPDCHRLEVIQTENYFEVDLIIFL